MKTLYSAVTAFFLFANSFQLISQCTSGWQWVQHDSGFERNELHGIAIDETGNTYIAGWFDSDSLILGGITIYNSVLGESGNGDMYVAKLDPLGNGLWARAVGGDNSDWCWTMAIDGNGNVGIGGEFFSSSITVDGTTVNNSGLSDIFVAVFDTDGNLVWMADAGTTGSDSATGIVFDESGNLVLTGQFDETAFFGIWPLASNGSDDIFVTKYNPVGDVLWAHHYGGLGSENGLDMAIDPSGNIVLCARSFSDAFSFGGDTYNNGGMADILIMKITSGGSEDWMKSFGSTNNDEPSGIAIDSNNNIVFCGNFWSSSITFGGTTLNSSGQDDMFIVKTNSDGVVTWAVKCGGAETDRARACDIDDDDNIYVCGHVGSAGASFNGFNYSTHGLFMSMFNSSGTTQWVEGDGGPILSFASWDEAFGIDVNSSGAIALGGDYMSDEIVLGDHTIVHTADFGMVQGFYANYSEPSLPVIEYDENSFFCEGSNNVLVIGAESILPLSYQWYWENQPIDGADENELVFQDIGMADAGNYYCEVTNDCGTVSSGNILVQVNDMPDLPELEWSEICVSADPIDLPAAPGGIWSGTGVDENIFYPENAGAGNHDLNYYYEDFTGCYQNLSEQVFVADNPYAGTDTLVSVCIELVEYSLDNTISANADENGIWMDENYNLVDETIDLIELGEGEFVYWYFVDALEPCSPDTAQVMIVIDLCIGISEAIESRLSIRQESDFVYLTASPQIDEITLLDLQGRICKRISSANDETIVIETSQLNSGIYQLVVSQNDQISCHRIFVEH